ncbi:MAG: riboflavin synthase [Gammaproteobacteria bacterium]|nr:riboflavin synthase [Gammaproteobacteria bacterium]
MFTGIIQSVGTIEAIKPQGGDARLTINVGDLDLTNTDLGDSIAVNGVCLTAIEYNNKQFSADVSNETLTLTSLKNIKVGTEVNLEKALTLNTALGGHIVSGHVDGQAELISMHNDGRSIRYEFEAPSSLAKYIAEKGSITIDGASLTVNKIENACFGLNIVPHTLENTIFKHYVAGTKVNIEVDIIARYLERLLKADTSQDDTFLATLTEAGFIQS